MRTNLLVAFSLAGLLASTATTNAAPVVMSGVTIDTITVDPSGQAFLITVKGTITLGTKDTYVGFVMSLTDPNGLNVTPVIIQFAVPAAGQTTNYTFAKNTAVKGQWTATATLAFKQPDGSMGQATLTKTFTVPAP